MLFTVTHRYDAGRPVKDLVARLTGRHLAIHDLDFEVLEKDDVLKVIPHAEAVQAIKTLPITHIDLEQHGAKTTVVVKSKMRRIDAGGPLLIMFFCSFLILASLVLLYVGDEPRIPYTFLGVGSLIFIVFYVRMQMGYLDYVRKLHDYIRKQL